MITYLKKNPKAFNELQIEFYKNMKENHLSEKLCHYVWDVLISMNKGYGFNTSHTLGYSIVALQEANLAYYYPIVYWNAANLISDSGGSDSTVKYDKIAQAIGRLKKEGIKITLPAINKVKFDFKPDAEANEIIFGLKPISGIGASIANGIIANQPYSSAEDFYNKMQIYKNSSDEAKFGDTAMIQLIKAGCFDELENKPREEIMKDFIVKISSPIKKLEISNIIDLNNLGLLTDSQKKNELRFYRFRNYIFNKNNIVRQEGKSPSTFYYKLDRKFAEPFFLDNFAMEMEEEKDYEYTEDGFISVKRGSFDKVFNKKMEAFKKNVLMNEQFLNKVNENRFVEVWNEKASGSTSKWEMDSLCMYYGKHELNGVDKKKYDIVNFDKLNAEPEIVDTYFYNGQTKPRFALHRLCGTVIAKDKNHNTVSLLTLDGVVTIKLYKGQFGFYDREISEKHEDGTKTKIESSWFKRGTKLLVTGYRSDEQFIAKNYKDSIYKHSIQLINDITDTGILQLQSERFSSENEEEKGDNALAI